MGANLEIDLRINDAAWEGWPTDIAEQIDRVLEKAASYTRNGSLDILLTGDEEIRSINAQWRDKDKPTDVLSFPAEEMPGASDFLGDIAVSYGVMSKDAERMGKSLEAHFSHLLVHGYLHLLGYDHVEDGDAEKMEALETKILADLGISDPYSAEILKEEE